MRTSPRLLSPALPFLLAATIAAPSAPARADEAGAPPAAIAPARAPLPSPLPADETRALRFTGGISLTAVGGIALVLSAVLGVRSLVSKNDIGAHCDAAGTCDLTGYTFGSQARDFALTSTITFTGGILAASAGVGLLLSAKPWLPGLGPSHASAWIAPTPRGVVAGARW